jgi:hypothetical protein
VLLAITIELYWKLVLVHQFPVSLEDEGANQKFAWLTYWLTRYGQANFPIWDPYTPAGNG